MSLPDDQPVRHQSVQNQVKSWISNSLFDNFTYTIRRGPIKGMKWKGGLAWIPDWLLKGAVGLRLWFNSSCRDRKRGHARDLRYRSARPSFRVEGQGTLTNPGRTSSLRELPKRFRLRVANFPTRDRSSGERNCLGRRY